MLHVLIINTFAKPIWERRWLWVLYSVLWLPGWLLPADLHPALNFFVLFALAAFVIPHAAADFYLAAWILNPPWTRRPGYWGVIIISFSTLAFLTYGISQISINFSVALFSAIIMWHWGSLDTIYIYSHRGSSWVIGSIGRGMLVLFAPLYFKPLETQELLLSLIGANNSPILTTLYSFSESLLILAIIFEFLAILINKFVEGRGLPSNVSGHITESLFILLSFAISEPIVGLTFYFLVLHSCRHLNRVPAYIPEARGHLVERGGYFRNFSMYFQQTNRVIIVATIFLAVWFGWNFYYGVNFTETTMATIRPLIALLIPHMLVSLLADFNPKQYEG